jgi:hypothetical protein
MCESREYASSSLASAGSSTHEVFSLPDGLAKEETNPKQRKQSTSNGFAGQA